MRLVDLEPFFLRHAVVKAHEGIGRSMPDGTTQWGGFDVDSMHHVDTLVEAQGIWFDCPKCYAAAGNSSAGVHGVRCFFPGRGVPNHLGLNSAGQPVRWNVTGNTFDNLSLTPSILLQGGCGWHGFITNGEVSIL
jgi:hypothetical protein